MGSDVYDLSVLVKGRDELAYYEPIRSELRACENIEDLLEDFTLSSRVRWKFKRTFHGWTYPRLEEVLLRLGATFAYPVCSTKVPSADWIADFQYHYFPDLTNAADIVRLKLEFSRIARSARRIVLSSYCAERDCHLLFPQSIGRTSVLQFRVFANPEWITTDPMLTVQKYNLSDRFILVSNSLIPTKNHKIILDALAAVPAAERLSMHIVCTGDILDTRNPIFYNTFLNRIHTLGLSNQVSILGVIPKRDQIQLLRAASAYLQPSLFEGWNTGVEEAHLFGKRIILSNIPVHLEQAPPHAILFNPHDAHDLASKLRDLFGTGDALGTRAEIEPKAFSSYANLQRSFARTFLAMRNESSITGS
jgi:glycosyltransferase involved in cell wall biosynthesis